MSTYGPWKYDSESMLLTLERDGQHLYEVPLDECTTSAQTLDWIMEVTGKTWASDEDLAGLLRALDDVLDPPGNLCAQGIERGPVKWSEGRVTR